MFLGKILAKVTEPIPFEEAVTDDMKMYFSVNNDVPNLKPRPLVNDFNSLGTWFSTNADYSSWHGTHTFQFEIPNRLFKMFNGSNWYDAFYDKDLYQKVFKLKKEQPESIQKLKEKLKNSYHLSKFTDRMLFNKKYLKAFRDNLISRGYHGIHMTPKAKWDGVDDHHVFLVFDPIKSGMSDYTEVLPSEQQKQRRKKS